MQRRKENGKKTKLPLWQRVRHQINVEILSLGLDRNISAKARVLRLHQVPLFDERGREREGGKRKKTSLRFFYIFISFIP